MSIIRRHRLRRVDQTLRGQIASRAILKQSRNEFFHRRWRAKQEPWRKNFPARRRRRRRWPPGLGAEHGLGPQRRRIAHDIDIEAAVKLMMPAFLSALRRVRRFWTAIALMPVIGAAFVHGPGGTPALVATLAGHRSSAVSRINAHLLAEERPGQELDLVMGQRTAVEKILSA